MLTDDYKDKRSSETNERNKENKKYILIALIMQLGIL
jgi:hypothetical protein